MYREGSLSKGLRFRDPGGGLYPWEAQDVLLKQQSSVEVGIAPIQTSTATFGRPLQHKHP